MNPKRLTSRCDDYLKTINVITDGADEGLSLIKVQKVPAWLHALQ